MRCPIKKKKITVNDTGRKRGLEFSEMMLCTEVPENNVRPYVTYWSVDIGARAFKRRGVRCETAFLRDGKTHSERGDSVNEARNRAERATTARRRDTGCTVCAEKRRRPEGAKHRCRRFPVDGGAEYNRSVHKTGGNAYFPRLSSSPNKQSAPALTAAEASPHAPQRPSPRGTFYTSISQRWRRLLRVKLRTVPMYHDDIVFARTVRAASA